MIINVAIRKVKINGEEHELQTTIANIDGLNDILNTTARLDLEDNENIEDASGGTSSNAVLYTPQDLTDEQKAQARENIGAGNGLTLKSIDLLIDILRHANYTEDMTSQIELLAKELMGGSGNTDSGSLIVTDDGEGNVVITASGSASITDDGKGNVTIVALGSTSITDDGNGNIIIA